MKILLVEDDIRLAETLAEALTDQLYVVDIATDGEAAWDCTKALNYDLLLLDLMLPEIDGITLCHRWRSHGYQMPILMITACDTISNKINGLDAGADDYIIKPVDLGELFARIRALLRRGNTNSTPILQWGDLQLNPSTYEVSYRNNLLHLTPKEYSLVELLLRNGRRVLSRSVIIENLWTSETSPDEHTVKVHLRSVRQKLKAVGAPEDFIETMHGLGYRLKSPDLLQKC
ncbi:response regulator transcription factor [Anabaena cylindrica FACHB-243]|uniref:Two component transcriptional regulator, winged helix family n=1 Tax=Anabaena cylindrica (strain ATCC 27899 / PCC 7122) TaxID=272123 RepID=K9ZFJ4_ANACC|nr:MULTISPECIES: response regulator transcription factor [Anabaena]AFZ57514.1 two component transcriptional regulator, winged helix family [Anabaena cylindrica PCC 7122]MBD2418451.1 response regulator transcription factor [Anabaena cylindrica FACHB-243]MBY5283662.1 response regulator transcription factor [Anabaena sp. CCAP 1446/1C]MBY5308438.1 response regulator transcription factor [Anabaena sp. CCAP 1446/1C]MCM2405122.1 response regulator transcription factor [Anabaena sp. CCAP 1446/1C]